MGIELIAELKKKSGMTNKQLAEKSGVPLGTINKIVSGVTKDPQNSTLRAIAKALNCSVEDFGEENTEEDQEYYADRQVSKMAQEIYDNPELRILFDASRKLDKDDVLAVVDIVKRMKGYTE